VSRSSNLSPARELAGELSPDEQQTRSSYGAQTTTWVADRNVKEPWQIEPPLFQELLPSGALLDLGCGAGHDAEFYSARGYQVTGVDPSYPLLELAAVRAPEAQFVHASCYQLPFPDASFDGVWAAASLLHVPRARIAEALLELRRVLRPNGILFAALKLGQGEQLIERAGIGPRFYCFWTGEQFAAALQEAGFEIEQSYTREGSGMHWLMTFARR
jgi:ubiquinone/menaquinone biosynthesis C-methylase UbiE